MRIDFDPDIKAVTSVITNVAFGSYQQRIKAITDEYDNQYKKILDSFKPSAAYLNFLSSLDELKKVGEVFSEGVSKILYEVESSWQNLWKSVEKITATDGLYRHSFEILGSYGWSVDWYAPPRIYNRIPDDLCAVDKMFKEYYTRENLQCLINDVARSSTDRISREAIMCFNRGCYSACASLLFTAIESKVIQYVKVPEVNNHIYGNRAIGRFKEQIENSFARGSIDEAASVGMIMSLAEFWHPSPNFADRPVINRNNLLHGMLQRDVTRLDCIKLILAYSNVLRYTCSADT